MQLSAARDWDIDDDEIRFIVPSGALRLSLLAAKLGVYATQTLDWHTPVSACIYHAFIDYPISILNILCCNFPKIPTTPLIGGKKKFAVWYFRGVKLRSFIFWNIQPTLSPQRVSIGALYGCSNIPHRSSNANEIARVILVRSRLPISNSTFYGSHLVRMMKTTNFTLLQRRTMLANWVIWI